MNSQYDSLQALKNFLGSDYNFRTTEGERLVRRCAEALLEKVLVGSDTVQSLESFAEHAGMLFEDHSKDNLIFPFPAWLYELDSLGRVWPETTLTAEAEVRARALLEKLPTLPNSTGREITSMKK